MFIDPNDPRLLYSGRIDRETCKGPTFVYPCSSVKLCITNTKKVSVKLLNRHYCYNNYMGVLVDGIQYCLTLFDENEPEARNENDEYVLADNLSSEVEHEILVFKRQDCAHTVQIGGFIADDGATVLECPKKPDLRLEFYGDSVTAGEVSEALEYCKKQDPVHKGEFSNAYWSYAWMTARKLDAELHCIAQGGIALLDDTGWFAGPDFKGIFNMYDRIEYHPDMGVTKRFDFSSYIPAVVVIAIGQNDANPEDYMATDFYGEKACFWRAAYARFIGLIRKRRPDAQIILTTTILNHNENWDKAIDEVCTELRQNDSRIHHFLYSENGKGTPGHIRIPEADKMSDELAEYIRKLLA